METCKLDIYERVTNQIVAAIEAGAGNFRMPWLAAAGGSPLPVNATSKRCYRGINVLALWGGHTPRGTRVTSGQPISSGKSFEPV